MSKDTGGPAFPMCVVEDAGFKTVAELREAIRGMTLRDYFAAKALQGLLADPNCTANQQALAAACYQYADTMLAERSK